MATPSSPLTLYLCYSVPLFSLTMHSLHCYIPSYGWSLHISCSAAEGVTEGCISQVLLLTLSENEIETIGAWTFMYLVKCVELNLARNKLKDVNGNMWQGLKFLEALSLAGNKLSFLNIHIFEGLLELKELHLGYNSMHINFIEPFVFSQFPNIEALSLYDNQLTTLTGDIFKLFENHPVKLELILSKNPLISDKRMEWIKEDEKNGWIVWYTKNG